VDSLDFPDVPSAHSALKRNHFNLISVEGQNENFDLRPKIVKWLHLKPNPSLISVSGIVSLTLSIPFEILLF
jgi:hypothetical protein